MQLLERLEAHRAEEQKLNWSGSFAEYFELVTQNLKVARLSHARIYDMVVSSGAGSDVSWSSPPSATPRAARPARAMRSSTSATLLFA